MMYPVMQFVSFQLIDCFWKKAVFIVRWECADSTFWQWRVPIKWTLLNVSSSFLIVSMYMYSYTGICIIALILLIFYSMCDISWKFISSSYFPTHLPRALHKLILVAKLKIQWNLQMYTRWYNIFCNCFIPQKLNYDGIL